MPTSLAYIVLRLEAVHLGDLLRIWVRSGVKINISPGFSRARRSAPDTAKPRCFTGTTSVSPREAIPRSSSLTKKRELFPGLLPTSPGSFALPQQMPKHRYPRPGSGILTRFPFDTRPEIGHFETEFPYLLGSTNPCPTAVHMEPFSTSVFKALI